jgi:DNA ligase D
VGEGKAGPLERYHARRDLAVSPEPAGGAGEGFAFVVQKHAARRLHYDLRLQFGDVLKSWAVPEGPSLDPKVKRLAVHTEDHPLDYLRFEGVIPGGQYGAGTMIVWDLGSWVPMEDPEAGYQKGSLKFRLLGEKLRGGWALVRLKGRRAADERGDNWLLIKERDLEADPGRDLVAERPESVLSGQTNNELEATPPARKRRLRPATLPGAAKATLGGVPRPQLASPAARPPEAESWLHEIKLDGYRTLARIEGDEVRLFTRSGHDWTDRYQALVPAFEALDCRAALLDGEVVVQDEDGRSSFQALQDALSEGQGHRLTYYAFDLLHLDGYDLAEVPLLERKRMLETLVGAGQGPASPLQLSEHVVGQGPAVFEQAGRLGLEGVVSKRVDAPYRPGRTRSWLKAKCIHTDEFVIVGFTTSAAAGGLAALLVADATEEGLRYAGRVGTGFTAAEAERLRARLEPLRRKTPPVRLPPEDRRADVTFVRPAVVAEVAYLSRTGDGLLRQAVYKGLRPDKPQRENEPSPTAPRPRLISDADLATIWVTNPDRRMFTGDGPTKLALALYYARVGDWLLPEILDRPLSLVRCPSGRLEDCFFQRHAMAGMPEAIRTIALAEKAGRRADYLYLADPKGFLALPQFGAVELHVWGCRVDQLEKPDRLVFDLDPDESLPWRAVVEAAIDVREALEAPGLVPFVKTTGGKGLHVVVPLARKQGWEVIERFAGAFAANLARRAPRRFTATMAKRERRGRIYLDWLRNTRGATAVAAYSLRARPGVPVATPLAWDDLSRIDDPADLDYRSVPERLEGGQPDPWAGIDRAARSLSSGVLDAFGVGQANRKRR